MGIRTCQMTAVEGVSSDHRAYEGITDLDGEHIELAKTIGQRSANTMHPSLPEHSLCKHRFTTCDGQENTGKVIEVLTAYKP